VTIPPSTGALELARQLLGRGIAGTLEPAETGAALQRTLARVSENLRRAIGDDGYAALLSRAIAQTQTAHPALSDIRGEGSLVFHIDRLTTDVGTHNIKVVSAAFESLLASIIDVLSGLIGADMVLNLLDPDGVSPASARSEDHNDRS
jgi:hypothetical protein